MSTTARLYISSVIIGGVAVMILGARTWHSQNPAMFVMYLIITILSAGLKVSLPGIKATMSVWFLFVLIGFTELSFSETLVLGCSAAIIQCI